MQLQLKTFYKLTQKLKLSAQIRLSLNLLQMPLIQLKEFIKEQAEINPLLDIENPELPVQQKNKDDNLKNEGDSELDFLSNDKTPSALQNYDSTDEEKRLYQETLITAPSTLQEHLLRQLRLLAYSEEDYKIGESIIGNIDDNGYLRCALEDISALTKISISKLEKVLSIIQTFDPIGVGARDLRECLLLQLKTRQEESLAYQIIDKYLSYLEKKRYSYIAKKLSTAGRKISPEMVKGAIKTIVNLEPKPGRSFSSERTIRLIPDALLRKNKEGYEIIFNDRELPQVFINDRYRQMIKQKNTAEEVKEYLRERLKAARSLINAILRRKETIKKIIEEIIAVQKEFLDNGEPNFKSLTLEHIAGRIDRHKSTISRAIANKYLQTPWGIFELRYFFSPGIKQEGGVIFSSKAIKFKIKELIKNEKRPLTDQEIANSFKREGISIARRTISKYRKQLKILSSKSR